MIGDSYPNGPRTSNEVIEIIKKPNRAPDHSTDFKTSFDQVISSWQHFDLFLNISR